MSGIDAPFRAPAMFSEEDELASVTQMLALRAGNGIPYDLGPVEVNVWRAKRAAVLLTVYEPGADCEPVAQVLKDLMCDLMHLADVVGADFTDVVANAAGCYVEETRNP